MPKADSLLEALRAHDVFGWRPLWAACSRGLTMLAFFFAAIALLLAGLGLYRVLHAWPEFRRTAPAGHHCRCASPRFA